MDKHKITLQTADQVPRQEFIDTMNVAYHDYYIPFFMSSRSFAEMTTRESVRLDRSVAALCGDQVVGVGLLGVREKRAWVGGVGVVPSFRRQSIARQIVGRLIGNAKALGLVSVQLEVIAQNQPAFDLYRSLGFETSRRLLVLNNEAGSPTEDFWEVPDDLVVEEWPPAILLDQLPALYAVRRPWQREFDSARAALDHLEGLAAFNETDVEPVGICLYGGDGAHVGILDLAALSAEIGAALLAYLIAQSPGIRMAYFNVPEDDPMLPALLAAGLSETLSQYEMVLELEQET